MTMPNFLLIGARAHPPPRARGEADRHPPPPTPPSQPTLSTSPLPSPKTLVDRALQMLRSSKTVHKRSSPVSLRSGRATPHPRFRFAIQLSGGDSCRMRLATSCGGADAGPKNPGPLRPAVLLATRPRSVGAR